MDAPGRRVAQYLRMSTEMQTYSLEYQTVVNAAYALAREWRIVKTYKDAGISGLGLKHREGLRQLLADVVSGGCGYDAVLVYDVSRWGRFQDLDQAAHYEFVCREAGVEIIYAAEPFAADGSLVSSILKHLKRVMAAEYSRDLSAKIRHAQRGLQDKGYWVGGAPGYGLRRLAVDPKGQPAIRMEAGQVKALHGYRTVLIPGPEEELQVVRRIYSLFLTAGLRMVSIAGLLNAEGVLADQGALWTRQRVRSVLTSEKYVGVLVGGKFLGALGGRRTLQPTGAWRRAEKCLTPIISRARFNLVQDQLRTLKSARPSEEALIAELREIWAQAGRLSTLTINAHPGAHCADVFKRRFGSLEAAYARVGYSPSRRQQAASAQARQRTAGRFNPRPDQIDPVKAWRQLEDHLQRLGRISTNTIDADGALPSAEWYRKQFGTFEHIYAQLGYEPSARQRFHIALCRPDRN